MSALARELAEYAAALAAIEPTLSRSDIARAHRALDAIHTEAKRDGTFDRAAHFALIRSYSVLARRSRALEAS